MPRPVRCLILIGAGLSLCACDAGDDQAMRRLDEQAQHMAELDQKIEALRTGEATLPALTAEDLPRLEKDAEALQTRLAVARDLASAARAAVARHRETHPTHELDAMRDQHGQTLTRLAALETELAGAVAELQRGEDRKAQRDWKPTPAELLAAENTAQVIRLDTSMRELLFAVEQERLTQDEANPELRYLMNQRELEVDRQARLVFDSRLGEAWEQVNQIEAQIAELNENAKSRGEALAVLEQDRAEHDVLLAAQAAAIAEAELAERDLRRVQTLITRARLAGK